MKAYYQIHEIAALYQISTDSLRYYERRGILSPKRDSNGYRLYSLQDIWKLNVLRDLRLLDFSTERIKAYFDHRTVADTLSLLDEEATLIEARIAELSSLWENIRKRGCAIRAAAAQPLGEIRRLHLPARRGWRIQENVSLDGEVDFLIKKLQKDHEQNLYIIGNNRIGAFLDDNSWPEGVYNQYSAVFIIDENGEAILPAGDYLSLSYRGGYKKSAHYWQMLLQYAQAAGDRIAAAPLEIYHIDIHETGLSEEFLTELQVLVQRKEDENGAEA